MELRCEPPGSGLQVATPNINGIPALEYAGALPACSADQLQADRIRLAYTQLKTVSDLAAPDTALARVVQVERVGAGA